MKGARCIWADGCGGSLRGMGREHMHANYTLLWISLVVYLLACVVHGGADRRWQQTEV